MGPEGSFPAVSPQSSCRPPSGSPESSDGRPASGDADVPRGALAAFRVEPVEPVPLRHVDFQPYLSVSWLRLCSCSLSTVNTPRTADFRVCLGFFLHSLKVLKLLVGCTIAHYRIVAVRIRERHKGNKTNKTFPRSTHAWFCFMFGTSDTYWFKKSIKGRFPQVCLVLLCSFIEITREVKLKY